MQVKGKLQVKDNKGKKSFMVILPTKKGETPFNIPELAFVFDKNDAKDGIEVDVEKDDKNNIVKVSIPGKATISAAANMTPKQNKQHNKKNGDNRGGYRNGNRQQPKDTNLLQQGLPSILGMPFHNPYTFIPFGKKGERKKPALLTKDEVERDRFTGIIELKVKTVSPLLTSQPLKEKQKGHAEHKALTIGNDVIIPATSIRGFLRYLLTVITGGPLTVVDNEMYLCQGRDLPMGVEGQGRINQQRPCVLARVVKAGNSKKGGTIELGETRIVPECDIQNSYQKKLPRPKDKEPVKYLYADYHNGSVRNVCETNGSGRWQIKLCGSPVRGKFDKEEFGIVVFNGREYKTNEYKMDKRRKIWILKKEGTFLGNGETIDLPMEFWREYANRNRHGAHPELEGDKEGDKKGDLVWLQLKDEKKPVTKDNIESIQWARWGRKGRKLTDVLTDTSKDLIPDFQQDDGLVALVTDMFGQVPVETSTEKSSLKPFAGRVRCDNLVFVDGKKHLTEMLPLAVLASPHPGCLPFYRDGTAQNVSKDSPLKGYKVYRTSKHSGIDDKAAPWKFENQGVYDESGRVKDGTKEKVNFSAELLKPNAEGTLRLSVRSLSWKELSLLLLVCDNNTWRLGGGKPLGLGQCEVSIVKVLDEFGNEFDCNNERREVGNELKNWQASQMPVETLRYPLAASKNTKKITRGGLTWFQKHASPKKDGSGLIPIHIDGIGEVSGQMLPELTQDGKDVLYGYDAFYDDTGKSSRGNNQFSYPPPHQFDPKTDATGNERSGGNTSQNQQKREKHKKNRK